MKKVLDAGIWHIHITKEFLISPHRYKRNKTYKQAEREHGNSNMKLWPRRHRSGLLGCPIRNLVAPLEIRSLHLGKNVKKISNHASGMMYLRCGSGRHTSGATICERRREEEEELAVNKMEDGCYGYLRFFFCRVAGGFSNEEGGRGRPHITWRGRSVANWRKSSRPKK